MGTFNLISTSIFDIILAPLGHSRPWFDLLFWPVFAGIIALLVYKTISNQTGITHAKNAIQVHLLEVVLFRDELRVVLPATAKALFQNGLYLGHNILPMLVMFAPMTAILVQLVSHYAYAPLPVGEPVLVVAKIDGLSTKEVKLELPEGISLDAPPVRTSEGEVAWRIKPEMEGDHVLKIQAGGHTEEKLLSIGGEPRKVSVLRTKSWEAFLYPAELVPAADSPVESIRVDRLDQPLSFFPDGEGGILAWFFGFSLLSGFLLKDRFGVTL
jgi:hypothetical protein